MASLLPSSIVMPQRTVFGAGTARTLLQECAAFGACGVLVHGRFLESSGRLPDLLAHLPRRVRLFPYRLASGEPTVHQVDDLRRFAQDHAAQWVAGVGGGSVLDAAKACAGLRHAPLPTKAYHDGTEVPCTGIPFVAVPTTAGTGSECTPVVVLTDETTGVKKSFRHPSLMARLAILDPTFLTSCPPEVIAASGMDAWAQAIESYVSRGATWWTDQIALKAVERIAAALIPVFHGANGELAADLLVGSYLAGMALSHARLGLVHGLAHPLGVRFRVPHGRVCAVCLPEVLKFNREAMDEKYAIMTLMVKGDLIQRVEEFNRTMGIQNPFAGQVMKDRDAIIRETLESGSTSANPRLVSAEDVERILDRLFRPR